jgi:hypothetical protein
VRQSFAIAGLVWSALLAAGLNPQAYPAHQEIAVEVAPQKAGKYEKLEFRIQVDSRYRNPNDPEEVDLSVTLDAPDGKQLTLPAFFCQQYERRKMPRGRGQASWMYPLGEPVWKARFAPMQLGTYRAVVTLKDRGGTRRSQTLQFECTPSDRKGFLHISRRDPRFFELSEGEPLFAIGQNLAFIGEGQYVNPAKAEEIFATLSRNGANYLRIWTCCEDWAMAVEARKSAWGRSWDWRPPIVPVPDAQGPQPPEKCLKLSSGDGATLAVSPSHDVALRPNTRYVLCAQVRTEAGARVRLTVGSSSLKEAVASAPGQGWTRLSHEFQTGPNEFWLGRTAFRLEGQGTAWLKDLSLKEATGGPELLWEADVNRRIRGYYNPVDCFVLDELVEAARQRGIYLQLCLITRDLYMSSLKDPASPEYQQVIDDATNLLRYAVARWGYSTSVAAWEYFNEIDPNLPTDRFYTELGEYLERIDPYGHLRTTSTWAPSARDCRHPKLDIADVHFYLRPPDRKRLSDEVEAVLDRTRFLRQHAPGKPAHLGEFGLANEKWQPTPEMQQSDQVVDFHNALWASALSGSSGTALFWWWDRLDRRNAYPHYRPLADFLAGVPWTTAGLKPTSATVSTAQARLVGLQGQDRAYLWLFNPQAAWSGVVIDRRAPTPISGATVEVKDLAPGTYTVQWWDTSQGKVLKEVRRSPAAGVLRLEVPTFDRDIACRIVP